MDATRVPIRPWDLVDRAVTDDADDRELLSWAEFGAATRVLAQAVADDGYRADVVVAVARGGLTVAGALAYALGVKNCGTMNVEFYTGVDERLDVPVVLPPTLDLVDVAGLRVLVADDVADTGHTLRLVQEVLVQHVAEAHTAVLYRKPRSVVAPTTSGRRPTAGSTSRGRPSRPSSVCLRVIHWPRDRCVDPRSAQPRRRDRRPRRRRRAHRHHPRRQAGG